MTDTEYRELLGWIAMSAASRVRFDAVSIALVEIIDPTEEFGSPDGVFSVIVGWCICDP